MMDEFGKSKRPRRRKAGAKLDRIVIRISNLTAALAAIVAILHGTGLL